MKITCKLLQFWGGEIKFHDSPFHYRRPLEKKKINLLESLAREASNTRWRFSREKRVDIHEARRRLTDGDTATSQSTGAFGDSRTPIQGKHRSYNWREKIREHKSSATCFGSWHRAASDKDLSRECGREEVQGSSVFWSVSVDLGFQYIKSAIYTRKKKQFTFVFIN